MSMPALCVRFSKASAAVTMAITAKGTRIDSKRPWLFVLERTANGEWHIRMRKLLLILVSASILASLSCRSRPARVVIGIALTSSNHPAVELAIKEINESGGIAGVPIIAMGLDWKVVTDFKSEDIIKRSAE